MNEERLRERLRDAALPDQRGAEERAWRVVRAAFESRDVGARRRAGRRWGLVIVVGLVILALGLSPAGAKVADLFSDVTGIGKNGAKPALTSLPAPGRILVTSPRGPWIVSEDGSKRLLGDYEDATWSPHGLYVAVTRGRELTATDPTGDVRWSLASEQPVRDPVWAPSGFRIAYTSGGAIRVVAGDGTEDHLLQSDVAPIAPAWRPLSALSAKRLAKGFGTEILAFVDRTDRIHVVDADSGLALWVAPAGPQPRQLLWTSDGRELVAVSRSSVRVFDEEGERSRTIALPEGHRAGAGAIAPDGRLALVRNRETRSAIGRSELEVLDLERGGDGKGRVFPAPGRFTDLAWSPNGRWLLVAWRDADQWLFIRPSDGRVKAVGKISRAFAPGTTGEAPFPHLAGWCCAPAAGR